MRSWFWWASAVVLFATSGCYVPGYDLRVNHAGALVHGRNEAAAEAARELAWDGEYPVIVHQGLVPPGLHISEDGRRVAIDPEHTGEWEFLAEVESKWQYRNSYHLGFTAMFWRTTMHEQHGSFRRTYCDAQAPLRAVTLSLWNLVPLSWACFPQFPKGGENVDLHLRNLVRATVAVGGNALVVGARGDGSELGTVPAGDWIVVYERRLRDVSLSGFAFRHVPGAEPRAPLDPRYQATRPSVGRGG